MSTIGELLHEGAAKLAESGSETPRLDAELLLGHILGVPRTSLLAQPEIPLGDSQATSYAALIARRERGEPVAYIRGLKEFHGLAFSVDPRALIPRPETETLVGIALDRIQAALVAAPRPPGTPALVVWDVGTGSGAIAVTVAVESRRRGYADDIRLLATDSSPDALALAVENAVAHGVADAIDFATADLTDLGPGRDVATANVLLANLPYIPSADVPQLPVAASFEPRDALDGGTDGLAVIGRLVGRLPAVLAPAGVALLEMGADQAPAIEELVRGSLADWRLHVHADLGGRPRVAEISRGEHDQ